jgi:hypothetical protein
VTVIVKLPVAVLPTPSEALQFTVVVPIGKAPPEAGVQLTGRLPETKSLAEALKVTSVIGPVASTVMLAGSVSVGAVVSTTVTVADVCATMVAS